MFGILPRKALLVELDNQHQYSPVMFGFVRFSRKLALQP